MLRIRKKHSYDNLYLILTLQYFAIAQSGFKKYWFELTYKFLAIIK